MGVVTVLTTIERLMVENMARRLMVVASLFALSGCWAPGQLRYRDHTELANVDYTHCT